MPPSHSPSLLTSFPPIVGGEPRVLILGSMPGSASLKAHRYYAHPQNRFWPMLGELVGAHASLPYSSRCQQLTESGIALWDVFARCERTGSLDSAIRDDTAQANDFAGFFAANAGIGWVLFNGAKAEQAYARLVLPTLGDKPLQYRRLPSTSPANASQRAEDKLAAWRDGLRWAGVEVSRLEDGSAVK